MRWAIIQIPSMGLKGVSVRGSKHDFHSSIPEPLPVTDLRSYHVTSEEIRFFWGPPTRGQFVGFIVEYHDSSGNFISEEMLVRISRIWIIVLF